MNDLFALITDDHGRIKSQIQSLIEASERGYPLDLGAYDALKASILSHSLAEEHILYDRLKNMSPSQPLAYESLEEHRLTETLLRSIEGISNPLALAAKLKVLRQTLVLHMEREESETFSSIRQLVAPDLQNELASKFHHLRQQIQSDMLGEPFNRREPQQSM